MLTLSQPAGSATHKEDSPRSGRLGRRTSDLTCPKPARCGDWVVGTSVRVENNINPNSN